MAIEEGETSLEMLIVKSSRHFIDSYQNFLIVNKTKENEGIDIRQKDISMGASEGSAVIHSLREINDSMLKYMQQQDVVSPDTTEKNCHGNLLQNKAMISKLSDLLLGDGGVSGFEMRESGITNTLVMYLNHLSKEDGYALLNSMSSNTSNITSGGNQGNIDINTSDITSGNQGNIDIMMHNTSTGTNPLMTDATLLESPLFYLIQQLQDIIGVDFKGSRTASITSTNSSNNKLEDESYSDNNESEDMAIQLLFEASVSGGIRVKLHESSSEALCSPSSSMAHTATTTTMNTRQMYIRPYESVAAVERRMASLLKDKSSHTSSATSSGKVSVSTSNSMTHASVQCDECGNYPITGFRYQCIQLTDYDLCENCFKMNLNSESLARIHQFHYDFRMIYSGDNNASKEMDCKPPHPRRSSRLSTKRQLKDRESRSVSTSRKRTFESTLETDSALKTSGVKKRNHNDKKSATTTTTGAFASSNKGVLVARSKSKRRNRPEVTGGVLSGGSIEHALKKRTRRSSLSTVNSTTDQYYDYDHIVLMWNDIVLPSNLSVAAALRRVGVPMTPRMWQGLDLTYRVIHTHETLMSQTLYLQQSSGFGNHSNSNNNNKNNNNNNIRRKNNSKTEHGCIGPHHRHIGFYLSKDGRSALQLLRIIFSLLTDVIHHTEWLEKMFVNKILSAKLSWEVLDVTNIASRTLPIWCFQVIIQYPFLFPFSLRRQVGFTCPSLDGGSFGRRRGLLNTLGTPSRLSDRGTAAFQEMTQLTRYSIDVERRHILFSSVMFLNKYTHKNPQFQVKFADEEGTGTGPTQEYFTSLGEEFQRPGLGLWLSDSIFDSSVPLNIDNLSSNHPTASPNTGSQYKWKRLSLLYCSSCHSIEAVRCSNHGKKKSPIVFLSAAEDYSTEYLECCECDCIEKPSACTNKAHCLATQGIDKGKKREILHWILKQSDLPRELENKALQKKHHNSYVAIQCELCKVVSIHSSDSDKRVIHHLHDQCSASTHRKWTTKQVSFPYNFKEIVNNAPIFGDGIVGNEFKALKVVISHSKKQHLESNILFPAPMSKDIDSADRWSIRAKLHLFKTLGRLIGFALSDRRQIDLPLSPELLGRIITKHNDNDNNSAINNNTFNLRSIRSNPMIALRTLIQIDRRIGNSFLKLYELCQNSSSNKDQPNDDVLNLMLTFSLATDDSIALIPGGCDIEVNSIKDLSNYIMHSLDYLIGSGVSRPIRAIRAGLSEVCDISYLPIFTPHEIDLLICGTNNNIDDMWNIEDLSMNIICDHGYTKDSKAVQYLLDTLCSFNLQERRGFLKFVTGSPRLPIGGWAALNPKLTIVRKGIPSTASTDTNTDTDTKKSGIPLPSSATCQNYLKLPDYTSIDILRERLMYAILECQNAFHLT